MNLDIIDPTQYPNWDDLLMSTSGNSIFHSSSWARVLKETYGYEPRYFTIIDQGRILALIPVMEVKSFLTGKRGVSLPFTDYCEPILDNGIKLQDLINSITEYGKKVGWRYVEFRGGNTLSPFTFPSFTYLRHTLNLSEKEDPIFSNFRDSTKRNIKKAMKEGVKVKIDHSRESVEEFYGLNCMTRKQHGLPPQPFGFFEKIHDHIISKDLGMVVLASLNQENIASAIYFHFGREAFYKYGASDNKYQYFRANNLVMWEAIKWYSQNGYKAFCLGRTEPENQGLIQFKSGWGTTINKIKYYRYDLEKGSFVSGSSRVTGFHNRVLRRMPAPLLNKLGALLYKHVG